jgi:N utilization substance protein B
MTDPRKEVYSRRSQLSAARLCAVQALYLTEFTDRPLTEVLADFLSRRLGGSALQEDGEKENPTPLVPPEPEVFAALVRGTVENKPDLDRVINAALDGDRTTARLEAILTSILRVGVFEMTHCLDVPPKVVISEYVDIAHAFFGGPEPKLVNAVLDRVAKGVRGDELAAPEA